MRATHRIRTTLAAAVLAAASGFGIIAATPASADTTGPLDASAYCANNPPVAGALSLGAHGHKGQNDWHCDYLVPLSWPVLDDVEVGDDSATASDFSLGPWQESFPISFANMCAQQYPGSQLQWVPGPDYPIGGFPWECVN